MRLLLGLFSNRACSRWWNVSAVVLAGECAAVLAVLLWYLATLGRLLCDEDELRSVALCWLLFLADIGLSGAADDAGSPEAMGHVVATIGSKLLIPPHTKGAGVWCVRELDGGRLVSKANPVVFSGPQAWRWDHELSPGAVGMAN